MMSLCIPVLGTVRFDNLWETGTGTGRENWLNTNNSAVYCPIVLKFDTLMHHGSSQLAK